MDNSSNRERIRGCKQALTNASLPLEEH
nr:MULTISPECIES: hypothetical protein [unclassified Paenibacillus]